MKSKFFWTVLPIFGVVTGVGIWMVFTNSGNNPGEMSTMDDMQADTSQGTGARQPLYWVGPMDPNLRRDAPGLDPMGMPLIPVYEAGDTISISASIEQNLGVRTAATMREDFAPAIQAIGYTAWDESTIHILHTRADGWLEVFNLASVGDKVRAGDVLYELFAPNLVSAQREYLTARDSTNRQLTAVARDRLLSLGFTAAQVADLDSTAHISNRLAVRAARDAIVTRIDVREGSYVTPASALATLASLDRVWIDTEVFESLAGWIEPGRPATVSFTAYPGETWETTIAYIYPNLDATTRSLRLRLTINNHDGRLRPNMFANVSISGAPRIGVLTVPREAVIRAGGGDRVILALGEGRFRPEVVRTGVTSGNRIEIASGLNAGDVVVTSGQFLLDSEANGEQALARLTAVDGDSPMPAMAMPMTTNVNGAMNTAGQTTQSPGATGQPAAEEASEIYETSGEIRQILPGTSVTISHLPVPALGWPAMVMGFQIPAQMDIGELSVGDAVTFAFQITPQGAYQLVRINLQDGGQ